MLDLSHEPDLGYFFYPHEVENHPGRPRLDIILREIPTERHYDPQQAHFKVITSSGYLEQISIHHPWLLAARYRVCAGRHVPRHRTRRRPGTETVDHVRHIHERSDLRGRRGGSAPDRAPNRHSIAMGT